MTGAIIDGRKLSAERIERVRERIDQRRAAGKRRPGLAVVLLGEDPASQVYVRNKRRSCERAGILAFDHDLPAETSQEELLAIVDELNRDPQVDGILIQLPLPPQIDQTVVINRIVPEKDVDGFHAESIGRLALRQPGLRPCTSKGIMTMLESEGVDPKGKHCVIVGASNLVGRPMVLEMLYAGATVTCCHKFTRDLRQHVELAEILVVAVGKPGLVPGAWVRPDAVVMDVGMNRLEDGTLCGDVDYDAARERARLITPVPGGVGPMTVASLIENTLQAAEFRDAAMAFS